MPLDIDLDSQSPVRKALQRFRREDQRNDAVGRSTDRRLLWQERLREYVASELEHDADTRNRVRGESARARLREG